MSSFVPKGHNGSAIQSHSHILSCLNHLSLILSTQMDFQKGGTLKAEYKQYVHTHVHVHVRANMQV